MKRRMYDRGHFVEIECPTFDEVMGQMAESIRVMEDAHGTKPVREDEIERSRRLS
jgi:hypothetical protein